ncbi:MAG: helix-turn-helix transcriptional regulator, partial [Oscillospiraceae bacterium]|nr:helix-turn-helix transcriptional regulator [Oscillospiraceae bacterium]
MDIKISENIKRLRRERNITQDALAAALGVTPQSVSKWEVGACYPDIELIPQIARFFAVSTDELFGTNDDREKKMLRAFRESVRAIPWNETERKFPLYREIIREFPENYYLLREFVYELANIVGRIPEICAEARETMQRALELNDDADMRYTAVYVYTRCGDFDTAREYAETLPPVAETPQHVSITALETRYRETAAFDDAEYDELRLSLGYISMPLNNLTELLLTEKRRRVPSRDDEYYALLILTDDLLPIWRIMAERPTEYAVSRERALESYYLTQKQQEFGALGDDDIALLRSLYGAYIPLLKRGLTLLLTEKRSEE